MVYSASMAMVVLWGLIFILAAALVGFYFLLDTRFGLRFSMALSLDGWMDGFSLAQALVRATILIFA